MVRLNKLPNFVPYEFIVIDNLSEDLILGEDFLRTYGASIDLDRNKLMLKRQHYDSRFDPMRKNERETEEPLADNSRIEKLYSADSVTIQPNYIARVKLKSEILGNRMSFIVEPTAALILKKGIVFPTSLVTLIESEASVLLENHTGEAITISRHMHVASGHDLAIADKTFEPVLATLTRQTIEQPRNRTPHTLLAGIDFSEHINKDLEEKERTSIRNILEKFTTLFPQKGEPPRQTHLVTHKINTGDHEPVRSRYNKRYAPLEREMIASEVRKMMDHGIVQSSESPWNSPVVLVRKKDGTIRFCVDYRELNKITKRDTYPLPRVDDVLDCLANAKFFSSLYLESGYHQCPVEERDREKTAFVTPDGLFEFKVMPFGLSNGPATFERLMDSILRDRKWKHCLLYLDDLCVFGRTLEEHNARLHDVLSCLDRGNLSLNLKKCTFGATQITILGHEISQHGIRPDSSKTKAVRDFPKPENQKAVRSFLGLCSYYRRFIQNFSRVAARLNELLKDGSKFEWSTPQQEAFEALKNRLTSPPVLGHFDVSAPVTLRTDACKYGIGTILAQRNENGEERVIAYASRTLTDPETRYSVTDQEGLAVIWAIKKFRPYIYGRQITVVTDHHALCWIMTAKNLTGRLARWAILLQ